MVPETMTDLRNLNPIASTAAVLPHYRLRFSIPGTPLVEPSFAAVEEQQDSMDDSSIMEASSSVHGVLYTLTEAEFAQVGFTEGVPFAYRWKACKVYPYLGDNECAGKEAVNNVAAAVDCYTLVAASASRNNKDDVPPSPSYLEILQKGAKQFKMDVAYQKQLQAIPVAKNLIIPNGIAGLSLQWASWRKQQQQQCGRF